MNFYLQRHEKDLTKFTTANPSYISKKKKKVTWILAVWKCSIGDDSTTLHQVGGMDWRSRQFHQLGTQASLQSLDRPAQTQMEFHNSK